MVDIHRKPRPWYDDAPDHIMDGFLIVMYVVCIIILLPMSPIIALLYGVGKYASKKGWV